MRRGLPRSKHDIHRPASVLAKKSTSINEALRPTVHNCETAAPSSLITPARLNHIPVLAPGERNDTTTSPFSAFIRQATTGPSQSLNLATQQQFSLRMHTDFSDVRIHTGAQASKAAQALQAQAFTIGQDIVFGANQYQPNSHQGQHLLAHELAHVAQPKSSYTQTISSSGDASEHEADQTAERVMQGKNMKPAATANATVQRSPLPTAEQTKADKQDKQTTSSNALINQATPFMAAAIGSTTLSDFDTGKAVLKPEHMAELSKTAHHIEQLLQQYPQSTLSIIGHTDTVGTEEHNLQLGQQRADATAEALKSLGISAAIMHTKSSGETAQAIKTKDEIPNAKNRRVEVRFEPKEGFHANLLPKLGVKQEQKKVEYFEHPKPQIDLQYHPPLQDKPRLPEAKHAPDAALKPLPADPRKPTQHSIIENVCRNLVDPVVDVVTRPFPQNIRELIKNAARDGVKTGTAKLVRLAAQGAGVKDANALDAIEKATEAAIQEKGKSP